MEEPGAIQPRSLKETGADGANGAGSGTDRFLVFLARGFGIGNVPVAPGTFGSVLGLFWFFALVSLGNPIWALVGLVGGILLAVPICGHAERVLQEKDPASVVLDEIVSVPLAFGFWFGWLWISSGAAPSMAAFYRGKAILLSAGIFLSFRIFDIWKPWPIRQSQGLPGGWGVVLDDALAGLYTNLLVCVIWIANHALHL